MNGEYVYDNRILVGLYLVFMILGFGLMATYNYPYIRYGIIAVIIIAMIVMRKKILTMLKSITSLRKKN